MRKQSAIVMSLALLLGASVLTSCGSSQKEQETAESNQKPATKETVATKVNPVSFENAKMNSVYADYIKLRDALKNDNAEDALAAASALATSSKGYEATNSLVASAHQINAANNLKEIRGAFATLNDNMIKLVKNEQIKEGIAYVAHCPMARDGKGANWLSDTKEIQNPYFGAKMSKCGTIQSTLE